ncbi:hypothetical protein [Spirosoma litoris]
MSTEQSYVGKGNYATLPQFRGHTYRTQTYLVVAGIARLTGEPESEIWKRIYRNLQATFGIFLADFPRRKNESLLRVAERYDVLDKVYLVAIAERQHFR